MKRSIQLAVLFAALFGLGFLGWKAMFPNQDELIRKQLREMAKLASFGPNEGQLAIMANSQRLSSFCTADVEISIGVPAHQQLQGRDELLGAAIRARAIVGSAVVELPDINVGLGADKQSAVADVTARVKLGGDKDFDVREFKCELKKINGDWLVSRIQTARTLRD